MKIPRIPSEVEEWLHLPNLNRSQRRGICLVPFVVLRSVLSAEGAPDAESSVETWFHWARGLVHENFDVPPDTEVCAMRIHPGRASLVISVFSIELPLVDPSREDPELGPREGRAWLEPGDTRERLRMEELLKQLRPEVVGEVGTSIVGIEHEPRYRNLAEEPAKSDPTHHIPNRVRMPLDAGDKAVERIFRQHQKRWATALGAGASNEIIRGGRSSLSADGAAPQAHTVSEMVHGKEEG